MNTNLYSKELKRNRKNLITWTLIVIGFTALLISIYPSMADMGEDLTQMMEKLPEELGKALGMDADTWTNVLGFYSTYYGIYIILLVGIFTMSTGATIISKEERDRTAEFLLTRPISRKSIFSSKILALLSLMLFIDVIQTVITVILLLIFGTNVDWHAFSVMHIHGFGLILLFTCLGVLISFFFRPKKNFMGMVVGIIFGCYFINALSKSTDAVSWLGYISPFHYLEFTPLDPNYSVNWVAMAVITAISGVALVVAHRQFQLKDIEG